MSCRCFDISRCQRELDLLQGTVTSDFQSADSSNAHISQALQNAAAGLGEAINTNAISVTQSLLTSLNGKSQQLTSGHRDECSSEVQRLSDLLEQWRIEDRAHHKALSDAQKAAKENSSR